MSGISIFNWVLAENYKFQREAFFTMLCTIQIFLLACRLVYVCTMYMHQPTSYAKVVIIFPILLSYQLCNVVLYMKIKKIIFMEIFLEKKTIWDLNEDPTFGPTVILILVSYCIKYKKWGPKFNLQYYYTKLMTQC